VEFEDGDGDVGSMHIREVTFSFLNFNFCALLFGLLTPRYRCKAAKQNKKKHHALRLRKTWLCPPTL
jgi:hypothetical protein